MRIILVGLCLVLIQVSCSEKHRQTSSQTKPVGDAAISENKAEKLTTTADTAERNEDESFEKVLVDLRAAYNRVERIDKTVIDDGDTLQLHETYYCLHDSSLRVPGHYMWGGADTTKDFIANTFATKIIVVNNRDTVLNKVFKKSEFDKILWNRLQQYAIIFDAGYIGYDKAAGEFAMGYSITIPLTDVGLSAGIAVSKTGKYRILDEYAKTDSFKKD